MIDDDFETVFRRMIEQFMGSMGLSPEGEISVRTWSTTIPETNTEDAATQSRDEVEVEEIDLGDEYLVLIDTGNITGEPSIEVDGRRIRVSFGNQFTKTIDMDFDIDIHKSAASNRNGVIELVLRKSEGHNKDEGVGHIHIE